MYRPLLILLSLCLPSLLLAQPLSVFTSVVPMKTLVERIGGEHVVVQANLRRMAWAFAEALQP